MQCQMGFPQLSLPDELRSGNLLSQRVAAASPPGESKRKDVRYLDIQEEDPFDVELVAN